MWHLQAGSTGAVRLNRVSYWRLSSLLFLVSALLAIVPARADTVYAVQVLREGGCGGILPAARPVHHILMLDQAAEQWAAGVSLEAAAKRSGYAAQSVAGVHINGADSSAIQLLRRSACRTVTSRTFQDIGVYHRGLDTWILLASTYVAPARSQAPVLADAAPARSQAPVLADAAPARSQAPVLADVAPARARTPVLSEQALRLVNDARARGTRCGGRSFGPAPPMKLSETLASVALGHASDMAEHNYFEHVDQAGHSPADRVRAVGYREKLVGENIAYGPQSVEEVVQGWLDSPDHCENIMDPRFAEMGLAYAAGQSARRGLFWVQLLAAPRV